MPLFIEILVSLFLLSMALFGMDATEFYAMQQSKTVFYANIASAQLTAMAARIMLRTQNLSTTMKTWNQQNQALLPQGWGKIEKRQGKIRLQISWGQSEKRDCQENYIGEKGCLFRELK